MGRADRRPRRIPRDIGLMAAEDRCAHRARFAASRELQHLSGLSPAPGTRDGTPRRVRPGPRRAGPVLRLRSGRRPPDRRLPRTLARVRLQRGVDPLLWLRGRAPVERLSLVGLAVRALQGIRPPAASALGRRRRASWPPFLHGRVRRAPRGSTPAPGSASAGSSGDCAIRRRRRTAERTNGAPASAGRRRPWRSTWPNAAWTARSRCRCHATWRSWPRDRWTADAASRASDVTSRCPRSCSTSWWRHEGQRPVSRIPAYRLPPALFVRREGLRPIVPPHLVEAGTPGTEPRLWFRRRAPAPGCGSGASPSAARSRRTRVGLGHRDHHPARAGTAGADEDFDRERSTQGSRDDGGYW